jgi:hypothetical protein
MQKKVTLKIILPRKLPYGMRVIQVDVLWGTTYGSVTKGPQENAVIKSRDQSVMVPSGRK